MQKKKSLLAIASLVAAAAIFFIACGDGEMIKIADKVTDLDTAEKGPLHEEIGKIVDDVRENPPLPPDEESSSSGEDPNPPPPPPSSPSTQSSNSGGVSSQSPTQSSGGGVVSSSSKANIVSSSSKPPTTSTACKGDAKPNFSCSWNRTSNLSPGFMLKPVLGDGKGSCEVSWSYAYGDQKPLLDDEIRFNCFALGEEGVESQGSTTYALFAQLKCDNATFVNPCTPQVSAGKAPYLKGDCKWLSPGDNDPLPKNSSGVVETSAGKGAKPSGVTLVDEDRICKKSTANDVVIKYGDGKTWNNSPEAGDYADVRYEAADCPDYNVLASPCDPLKVAALAPDEVKCVRTTQTACTLNGKAMGSELVSLSNASEGCMDITIDWQDNSYPQSGNSLNIQVQCSYTGADQVSKTCKVTYNGKESTGQNQTTTNAKCDTQHDFAIGTVKGTGKQTFYKVCAKVVEGGKDKETGISCKAPSIY